MSNYRRANVAGGTYFFTVTTLRRLPVLTEAPVRAALRDAIRQTRLTHPFDIDAWVLLPDHLHCIWTCRKAMLIFRCVGQPSSALFPNNAARNMASRTYRHRARNATSQVCGNVGFGNIRFATIMIFRGMSITSIGIRSSMDLPLVRSIGLIRRFRVSSRMGFIRPIGGWAERI